MISAISWLAFKTWLKKAWVWCKKNWKIFVGAAITIVLMIVFRKNVDLGKVLDRVRDDYEKEIDAIEKSHKQEIEKREEAVSRMIDTMKKVEEKYKSSKQDLDSRKRKEIEKILKNNSNDPDEITRRLSEITGFKIRVE